jgi:hypothetical protein
MTPPTSDILIPKDRIQKILEGTEKSRLIPITLEIEKQRSLKSLVEPLREKYEVYRDKSTAINFYDLLKIQLEDFRSMTPRKLQIEGSQLRFKNSSSIFSNK